MKDDKNLRKVLVSFSILGMAARDCAKALGRFNKIPSQVVQKKSSSLNWVSLNKTRTRRVK